MLKTPNRRHKGHGKKHSSHARRNQKSSIPFRRLRDFVGRVQRVGCGSSQRLEIV
jgi:hypothetical protein